MPLVTVPQVNPNDEITADSVNKGSNAIATVVNGLLDDQNIATVNGSKLPNGTVTLAKINAGSTAGVLVTDASGNIEARTSLSAFVQGTLNTTSGSPAYTPVNVNGGPSLTYAAVAGKKYEITVSVSYISAPSGEVNIQVLRPTDSAPLSVTTTIGGGNVPLVGIFEYTETTTTNRTLVIRMAPQATNATIRTDNPRIKVVQIG